MMVTVSKNKRVAMLSNIDDATLTKVAEALGEEDAVLLIDVLKNSVETTDDEIAGKTGIRLNAVRKILYKLYDHSLVGLRRTRDPKTGWFIFHWKLQPDQLEGFVLIGDIEFACFNEILPRGFHRTMCSRDGIIVAEIFHEKVRGFDLVLRILFGRLCLSYKGVHLTTEFSDGSLVYTVTGKKGRKSIPLPLGITKQYVATKTSIRDMIEIHKSKIKEHIQQNPDNNALAIRTFQQWTESLNKIKAK